MDHNHIIEVTYAGGRTETHTSLNGAFEAAARVRAGGERIEFRDMRTDETFTYEQVEAMVEQFYAEMEKDLEGWDELGQREARSADDQYDFLMRQQRRESEERACHGDPGLLAEAERRWAEEDDEVRAAPRP